MQEADYGLTEAAFATNQANARYQGDEHLLVRFYIHPKYNATKSEEEGRPIFIETAYIEIITPGNKDHIIQRPASDMDKHRFAEHWRRFEARQEQNTVEGTLLEEWPMVTRSQAEELKFFNIKTVEQLAGLTDSNAQNILGANLLREKAKKFLETASDEANAEALASAREEIEELKAQMAELLNQKQAVVEEDDED